MLMLKSYALWFICFGFSLLVESWGWTEQGKAFLYILLVVIFFLIILAIVNATNKYSTESKEIYRYAITIIVIALAILFVTTWVASKLFNIDYYVAFQIITLGLCMAAKKQN